VVNASHALRSRNRSEDGKGAGKDKARDPFMLNNRKYFRYGKEGHL
jgi:hypothetical protein